MVEFQQEPEDEEGEEGEEMIWSWRKLLKSVFRIRNKKVKRETEYPDSYSIYNRHPTSRITMDGALHSITRIVPLLNTVGSIMAPHVNPTATECGIVLTGSGRIQIVYPKGTSAMNVKVSEGDVFWVPSYFAFCQIASRTGPFESFGFTTSSRKNRPQFLVGASSLYELFPLVNLRLLLA